MAIERHESPVVHRTFRQRILNKNARTALAWGCLNLTAAIALYLDISWGTLVEYFNLSYPVVYYAECSLATLFLFNTIVDICRYLGFSLSSFIVDVTPSQKQLLGVKDSDSGFRNVSPSVTTAASSPGLRLSASTIASPYSPGHASFLMPGRITPPPQYSPGSAIMYSCTPSPTSRTPSPLQLSGYTGPGGIHGGSFLQASPSYIDNNHVYAHSNSHLSFSPAHNSYARSGTVSPLTAGANLSSLFHESLDTSGLRNRLQNITKSPSNTSILQGNDLITDQKSLQVFLREQEERDRSSMGSPDSNTSNGASFWNYNRSMADYTPVLRKYQYQIACRSPQSTKSRDADPDDPATYRGSEVWLRAGVPPSQLEVWTEKVRKWLSQTIVCHIAKEIQSINTKLVKLGSEELQIGSVSISTLKQMSVTKGANLPTLNPLIPYLECSSNQEYLVQRIQELGSNGAMSEFMWSSGGELKGKSWAEHLPTDAAIVMHLLCTYMDSRLPPHPKYPDGKTFSSQHFLRSPDKPDLKREENLILYQSKVNPPHFKVIIGDDTWDLEKGRSNMFHAILLFFHHVNSKENGMLGRVNLGLSGVNILWVLESKMQCCNNRRSASMTMEQS